MPWNRVDRVLLALFILALALATRTQADDGCIVNKCVGVRPYICSGVTGNVCKYYQTEDCGPCNPGAPTNGRCPDAGGQQNLFCGDDQTIQQQWKFCNNCPLMCDLLVYQCAAAQNPSGCEANWRDDPFQWRKYCIQVEGGGD
jgi:hypothetical protein